MYILQSIVGLSIFLIKRTLMTKQERFVSEIIALHDENLRSIIHKADRAETLLLQSIFDRQIQEYIHRICRIPIDLHDRCIYRFNSMIIHHPSDFDRVIPFPKKHRFIPSREYDQFALFFLNMLKDL